MALTCILVFNLESYEYFRPVFVEVLCHSFMRFEICKGYIFPYEVVQEDLLAWKVYYRIYFEIPFFTVTHVPLEKTCFSLV